MAGLLKPLHGIAAAAATTCAVLWALYATEENPAVKLADGPSQPGAALGFIDYFFTMLDTPLCFAVRNTVSLR
jgi:hypothetical protein